MEYDSDGEGLIYIKGQQLCASHKSTSVLNPARNLLLFDKERWLGAYTFVRVHK